MTIQKNVNATNLNHFLTRTHPPNGGGGSGGYLPPPFYHNFYTFRY